MLVNSHCQVEAGKGGETPHCFMVPLPPSLPRGRGRGKVRVLCRKDLRYKVGPLRTGQKKTGFAVPLFGVCGPTFRGLRSHFSGFAVPLSTPSSGSVRDSGVVPQRLTGKASPISTIRANRGRPPRFIPNLPNSDRAICACLLRRLHTLFRPERRELRGTVAAGNGGCFPRCSPRWGMSLRSIPHRSPRGTVQPAAFVATCGRRRRGGLAGRDHATGSSKTGPSARPLKSGRRRCVRHGGQSAGRAPIPAENGRGGAERRPGARPGVRLR